MVITPYSSITTSLLVLTDSVRVPFPRFSSLALVPVSFVIRCYPAGSPYCHFLPLSNTRQGRFRCKNAPVRGKRKEERARKEGKRKGRPVDLQQLCILSCTHTHTHTRTQHKPFAHYHHHSERGASCPVVTEDAPRS